MSERSAGADESGLPPDVTATAVTVGTFDGVHRGHRDVLAHLVDRAREDGLRSVLVTFDSHPLEVVNPTAAPPLLTVDEEKREVLAESGIDYCAVLPFTANLARYSAEQFVTHVLLNRFRMQCLLMGYDHGFGRNRSGDVHVMRALGTRHGFRVEVLPPVSSDEGGGLPISSTAIRRAVAGGDLDRAANALGRLYSVSARVVRGAQRGRQMGFPTINLQSPPARKLLPPQGVYAVRVQTPDGAFGGMMNLGPRPTFGDATVTLEAHLFDAAGNWYDRPVRVDFVARLRETRRFSGPDALRAQLARDEANARRALARSGQGIAGRTTTSVDASKSSP